MRDIKLQKRNDKLLFIERHPVKKYMAHDYDYVPLIHISELYFLLIPEHYFHAAVVGSIDYFFYAHPLDKACNIKNF